MVPAASGYVARLTMSASIVEDESTARVCTVPPSGSCFDAHYKGFKKSLFVAFVTEAAANRENTWAPAAATYVLKDAAGNVVAKQAGNESNVARFDRLGATVCVETGSKPADDAGVSSAFATTAEVCAPVTVTSLEPTEADREAHQAAIELDCGPTEGEGCRIARPGDGVRGLPAALLALVAATLAASARRRRLSG